MPKYPDRYLSAKAKVYRFGAVWNWRCTRYGCYGGRDRAWENAFARAVEHARTHVKTIPTW